MERLAKSLIAFQQMFPMRVPARRGWSRCVGRRVSSVRAVAGAGRSEASRTPSNARGRLAIERAVMLLAEAKPAGGAVRPPHSTGAPAYPDQPSVLAVLAAATFWAMKAFRLSAP